MQNLWSALSELAFLLGRRIAARDLEVQSAVSKDGEGVYEVAACTLQEHGFQVGVLRQPLHELPLESPPLLLVLKSGEVVLGLKFAADAVTLWHAAPSPDGLHSDAGAGHTEQISLAKLQESYAGIALVASLQKMEQADALEALPAEQHWFWSVFRMLRRYYGDCAVAAVLVNLLTLVGSMFAMNVYDRVIPNSALHTLWVLAIGVMIAALLEFFLRALRSHVVDQAGKRADLLLSATIFRKVLNLFAKDRPSSSAQFASHLREFESVREFVSSTTLVGLTDLPFVFLFLLVIGFLGGPLVWVPIVASLLVLVTGMVSQWPMRRAIERYQYENSQKFAYSVEALERLETIQALGAVAWVQTRWERLCAQAARSSLQSRLVSSLSLNVMQLVQQTASTALIVWGVYLILQGHLTTGGLIGCSILASRALAPMGQIAGLMTRWQQARVAFQVLDRVMLLPSRYESLKTYLHLQRAQGDLKLERVDFTYPHAPHRALSIEKLHIVAGETIVLMGPIGSGKSTLLKLLAGLQVPDQGQYLMDGIDAQQIAPADFRSQISWVGQDAVLFRGSLRENVLMGSPQVSEEKLLSILQITGVLNLANAHPQGLDMQLGENGGMLSGGQRQMVALARSLLSDAPIVLLDEPTGAFDRHSEMELIHQLRTLLAGRTLIIATHRPAPLELAKRLIMLDQGRIVADGPRDAVLQAVNEGRVQWANAAASRPSQPTPSARVEVAA